jgi:hypothetical protein
LEGTAACVRSVGWCSSCNEPLEFDESTSAIVVAGAAMVVVGLVVLLLCEILLFVSSVAVEDSLKCIAVVCIVRAARLNCGSVWLLHGRSVPGSLWDHRTTAGPPCSNCIDRTDRAFEQLWLVVLRFYLQQQGTTRFASPRRV